MREETDERNNKKEKTDRNMRAERTEKKTREKREREKTCMIDNTRKRDKKNNRQRTGV